MTYRILFSALLFSASLSSLSAAAQTDADRDAARAHFRRGVELFEESNNLGALIEFEAAYEKVPNHRLLFNIGNVHAALNQAVEAVAAYESYLAQGGATIAADRRTAVEAALETQRARIGEVIVTSNVEGATVTLDGDDTELTTPMSAPLRLSIGRYSIGLRLTGYEGPRRQVTVAGGTQQTIEVELTRGVEAIGNVRVDSNASDVDILVDGEVVGTTPLNEELVVAPGAHEILGRRSGYLDYRERVMVEEGGAADVDLRMEIDPDASSEDLGTLALTLPDADTTLRVDGLTVAMNGGRVDLPVGRHLMVLNVEEREEVRETVEVSHASALELTPALQWTDSARRTRLDRAGNFQTIGWVFTVAGAGAALGSLAVFIWNEGTYGERNDLEELYHGSGGCWQPGELGGACRMIHGPEVDDRHNQLHGEDGADSLDIWRIGSIIGLVAGVAVAAAGIGFLVLSPSEEEIDAGASAELRVGPGRLDLVGTF